MPNDNDPTLAELRARYRAEKRLEELHGNWALIVLHRLPGFYIARLALRRGYSAMQITGIAALLVPLLPLAALWLPPMMAALIVMTLSHFLLILDCADGDIARFSGQTSRLGGDVDLLVDLAHWGMLYLSIGIIADQMAGDTGLWIALGLLAAWLRLFARLVKERAGSQAPAPTAPPRGLGGLAAAGFIGIDGLLPFLALAALTGPWPVLVLIGIGLIDLAWGLRQLFTRPQDKGGAT